MIEQSGGEVDRGAMSQLDCPSYDGDVEERGGCAPGALVLRERLELCE